MKQEEKDTLWMLKDVLLEIENKYKVHINKIQEELFNIKEIFTEDKINSTISVVNGLKEQIRILKYKQRLANKKRKTQISKYYHLKQDLKIVKDNYKIALKQIKALQEQSYLEALESQSYLEALEKQSLAQHKTKEFTEQEFRSQLKYFEVAKQNKTEKKEDDFRDQQKNKLLFEVFNAFVDEEKLKNNELANIFEFLDNTQ